MQKPIFILITLLVIVFFISGFELIEREAYKKIELKYEDVSLIVELNGFHKRSPDNPSKYIYGGPYTALIHYIRPKKSKHSIDASIKTIKLANHNNQLLNTREDLTHIKKYLVSSKHNKSDSKEHWVFYIENLIESKHFEEELYLDIEFLGDRNYILKLQNSKLPEIRIKWIDYLMSV